MKSVKKIVYRYLTHADFFNINKPPGTEQKGGGQSYIDFSTKDISVADWGEFLSGVGGLECTAGAQGPRWEFPIFSIGIGDGRQAIEVYQRRPNSVSIARQKLDTAKSNRVRAWLPSNGFPRPVDATNRHQCPPGLIVVLLRTSDDEIWASWFLNNAGAEHGLAGVVDNEILKLLVRPEQGGANAGLLSIDGFRFDEALTPFHLDAPDHKRAEAPPERAKRDSELEEDRSIEVDFDADIADGNVEVAYSLQAIRSRNRKAVRNLKKLYRHRCQITDDAFLFQKRNGVNYTEVHHLVPLGEGGADTPSNMVVLCPQMHSMLHHASVEGIDLSNRQIGDDGSATLDIRVNGKRYTITWLPLHAQTIVGE